MRRSLRARLDTTNCLENFEFIHRLKIVQILTISCSRACLQLLRTRSISNSSSDA
jgi:hypothetical protein